MYTYNFRNQYNGTIVTIQAENVYDAKDKLVALGLNEYHYRLPL